MSDVELDIKGVSLEAAQALGFKIRTDLGDGGWIATGSDETTGYWVAQTNENPDSAIKFNPITHLQSLALIENRLMARNMSEFKTTVLDERLLLNYTYPDNTTVAPPAGFTKSPQPREVLAATHVTEYFADHGGNKWKARAFGMARLLVEVHRRPRW